MPRRWQCSCGAQVPIAFSFCGTCGKRWDRVATGKQTKPPQKSTRKGSEASAATDALGLALQRSLPWSLGAPSNPTAPTPAPNTAAKTNKAIFHQRANRIGKVEARIAKLQTSLTEIQQTWPRYVNQVQQLLAQEHQKCVEYYRKSTLELQELQQELNDLLASQPGIMPPGLNHGESPQLDFSPRNPEILRKCMRP